MKKIITLFITFLLVGFTIGQDLGANAVIKPIVSPNCSNSTVPIQVQITNYSPSGSEIDFAVNPVTAYCLIEQVPIDQIAGIDQFRDLHNNLMKNYRLRNWKFCEDAIEHLRGQWGGELDSFYTEMSQRILQLRQQVLDDSWHGIIDKTR